MGNIYIHLPENGREFLCFPGKGGDPFTTTTVFVEAARGQWPTSGTGQSLRCYGGIYSKANGGTGVGRFALLSEEGFCPGRYRVVWFDLYRVFEKLHLVGVQDRSGEFLPLRMLWHSMVWIYLIKHLKP